MCALCDLQTDRTKATLDPALVAMLGDLAARGLATPDPAQVGIAEARRVNELYFRAISEPQVAVRSVTIVHAQATDGFDVPVKVAVPLNAVAGSPAVLYCHGGGYAFGDISTHDGVIRAYADAFGMPVFGIDYRRTPEHAYPAALEDTLSTVAAARSSDWASQFRHDPAKILIIGDSAGAHLALTTMIALRARGLPQLQGAGLMYGMYARRYDTWSHHAYGDGSVGLSSDKMRWFWDQLMGQDSSAGDMLKEPLDADLSGFPPLALLAAEVDCLLDDTLDLVENCKRQGQRHSFDLVRNVPHGFMHLSSIYEPTRRSMALLAGRLSARIG
jgi:acetyl esterase